MRFCRTPSTAGLLAVALALVMLNASAQAKQFFLVGTVQQCTPTCASFEFLTIGSELSGFLEIDDAAVAVGAWTGGDVTDLGFSVLNPAIPTSGPSNPPNPGIDNPFNLNQTADGGAIVVANGQMITNPRGTFPSAMSAGTTDGARLTSGFVDMWLTQGLLANNGAVITISIDVLCTNAEPDIPASCFEVNIFEGVVFVSGGDVVAEPAISTLPPSLDYGQAGTGDMVERVLTVSSDGQVDLNIGNVALADPLDPPFSISDDTCSNMTLAVGDTCTITTSFDPTVDGTFADTFDIPSDATTTPVLSIDNTGIASAVPEPNISIAPTSVDFGVVEEGSSADADVVVANTGTDTLTVTDATSDTAEFVVTNNCGDLDIDENCIISVTFMPGAPGDFAGTLTVSSNDPNSPTSEVSLAGTGSEMVEPPPPPGSQTKEPPGFALDDDGGGGCFIATAAYGSYLHPRVEVLRAFRDEVLLSSAPGRAVVDAYYQLSPPVADYLTRSETARLLTRWTLTPLVFALNYPLFALALLALAWIGIRRRRRPASAAARTSAVAAG